MNAEPFRIAITLLANSRTSRWDDARQHKGREELLSTLIAWAGEEHSEVLQLPAGFFVAETLSQAKELAEAAARLSGEGLLLCVGVDLEAPGAKQSSFPDSLPFYSCVSENGAPLIEFARQHGAVAHGLGAEKVAAELQHRIAASKVLRGRKVALGSCGEALSEAWRQALHETKPSLVLNPSHQSVQLGGQEQRGWASPDGAPLKDLPASAAWAFAEHVTALGRWAGGEPVALVRASQEGVSRLVDDSIDEIAGARVLVYETRLA